MKDLAAILSTVETLRGATSTSAAGEPSVLVTLVKTQGSTYRRPGARMLILPGCRTIGTISGGCLESSVAREAWDATRAGQRVVMEVESAPEDDAWGPASGCHGRLFLLAEPIAAGQRHPALEQLARLRDGDSGAVIVHQFTLGNTGELVPGGMHAEPARAGADHQKSRWVESAHIAEFREFVPPRPHLLICGAGDDARPVARIAGELGWRITVIDSRARFATQERFPGVDDISTGGPPGIDAFIRRNTAAVLMSHRFADDTDYLAALLGAELPYIGLLGPRRRTERMLAELSQRNPPLLPTPGQCSRLFSPIGLNLGSEGAETIALAIVAEVQAVLAGRGGRPLSEMVGPIHAAEASSAWQP